MSLNGINGIMAIASIILGVIALLLLLIYVIEITKGVFVAEYNVIKSYVNGAYTFALAILSIQWITTSGIDGILFVGFIGLLVGWILMTLTALVISCVVRENLESKRSVRMVALSCVPKIMILIVLVWFIY